MFASWSDIYSNSAFLRSAILFAHVGGLLVGAGSAVAMDRITLTAAPGDAHQLKALAGSHRIVLGGLVAIIVSGVLMLAANLDTFLVSRFFWTKMALVLLLLINGVRLTRAEAAARAGAASGWARLRSASVASMVLWVLITLFGAILPNV